MFDSVFQILCILESVLDLAGCAAGAEIPHFLTATDKPLSAPFLFLRQRVLALEILQVPRPLIESSILKLFRMGYTD